MVEPFCTLGYVEANRNATAYLAQTLLDAVPSSKIFDLDLLRLPSYHFFTSQLFGVDLGFHAEWLRDEP
jgi:hypothetical protein